MTTRRVAWWPSSGQLCRSLPASRSSSTVERSSRSGRSPGGLVRDRRVRSTVYLGVTDAVDLAMEMRAGLAAGDGCQEGSDQHGGEGDQASGGEAAFVDRDTRELQAGEDVVLGAEQHAGEREHDGDREADQPDG